MRQPAKAEPEVDVEKDIENDYAPDTGKHDCIFEAQGCPRMPWDLDPPGLVLPGNIVSADGLREHCLSVDNHACDRITLGGHGIRDGCGFKMQLTYPDRVVIKILERDLYSIRCGRRSDQFDYISKCFNDKIKPGGYIRICSCGFDEPGKEEVAPECAQEMADETQTKVCCCTKKADFAFPGLPKRYCHCEGKWDCKLPRPKSPTKPK